MAAVTDASVPPAGAISAGLPGPPVRTPAPAAGAAPPRADTAGALPRRPPPPPASDSAHHPQRAALPGDPAACSHADLAASQQQQLEVRSRPNTGVFSGSFGPVQGSLDFGNVFISFI